MNENTPITDALRLRIPEPKAIQDLLVSHGDFERAANDLADALKKIIEMNRMTALDKYGDPEKAESWGCVVVSREGLADWAKLKGEK